MISLRPSLGTFSQVEEQMFQSLAGVIDTESTIPIPNQKLRYFTAGPPDWWIDQFCPNFIHIKSFLLGPAG
jgi:hypothetical protein